MSEKPPAAQGATYRDLLDLPQERFLGGPFDDDHDRGGPGGWWIFVEVDVALSEHDIVRPDLAGWRRERLIKPGATRPTARIPPFDAIELEVGRLFLPRDADEGV